MSRVNQLKYEKTKALVTLAIGTFVIGALLSIIMVTFGSLDWGTSLSNILYTSGRFFGLLGFLCISFLVISGDTARIFDRIYGIDRIIKFQRKFAIATYFIVFSHPLFFILSNTAYLEYLLPDFSAIPLAFGTLALYTFSIIMISSLNYKRISHKTWQYLHVLTYMLFFLSLYHARNWGSSASMFPVNLIFLLVTLGVFIGIMYRTRYKFMQRKHLFTVNKVMWETNNTFSVTLTGRPKINFMPGQFCFLRIENEGLFARHPFSISNSPAEKELRFTIKLEGKFTKAASELAVGDEVKIEGSFGNFVVRDTQKHLVFIAGGVGITPFMSMIKSRVQSSTQKVTLLYGSQTFDDIIFREELDSLRADWLTTVHILSKEKRKDFESGYISEKLLKKYVQDLENTLFYICGPESMKNESIKILYAMGVKKSQIFFEDFFW